MRVLEVIALNSEDVEKLNDSLVDRIEFCVRISEDGLTPSKAEILEVLKVSQKKVNVMVRNRNSFVLEDEDECEYVLSLVKWLAHLKGSCKCLNGVVLGYITADNKLNEAFLEKLNLCKGELDVTFHKAVDKLIINDEWKKLKKYEVTTILTQGGENEIVDNVSKIEEMIAEFDLEVEILLGGGINKSNIDEVLKLNTSIHLGSLARINGKYTNDYDIIYLNDLKKRMT